MIKIVIIQTIPLVITTIFEAPAVMVVVTDWSVVVTDSSVVVTDSLVVVTDSAVVVDVSDVVVTDSSVVVTDSSVVVTDSGVVVTTLGLQSSIEHPSSNLKNLACNPYKPISGASPLNQANSYIG